MIISAPDTREGSDPEGRVSPDVVEFWNKMMVRFGKKEEEYNKQFDKLPALLTTPSGTFSFTPKDSTTVQSTQEIMATVSSPRSVANTYRGALSIEPTSKSTTIAQISVKSTHTQRGMDFINKLVEVYNRDANDDKNEVATKTAEFIDERIKIINGELGTTEQELETFKRDAGLTDLKSDAQLALSENSEYDAAKEHQAMLEMKINQLKAVIGDAKIIDTSKLKADTVQILSKVEMRNVKNNMKMTYTIVSETEANLKEGKISVQTPIAQGLLGKKVGDVAEIKIPHGTVQLEITNISFE